MAPTRGSCVETIETSAVSLGEFGAAPRFTAAVTAGALRVKDSTCPALHAAFQAAEKGVPFMPLRGLIGSDVLAHRPDWKVVDNPFDQNDPIVLLPAITPDVALFHAPLADRDGNVWIGRQRELITMAHAAEKTIVTSAMNALRHMRMRTISARTFCERQRGKSRYAPM